MTIVNQLLSFSTHRIAVFAAVNMLGLCCCNAAQAETGRLNVHLELGPGFALAGWQAEDLGTGFGIAGSAELAITEHFGIEAGVGYLGFGEADHPEGYQQVDSVGIVSANAGVRVRLLNDEEGFLWSWGKKDGHKGNLWGNLWLDLRGDYYRTGTLDRFGADIGVGAEASVINGLQLGPFARCAYIYQPNSNNNRDSADAWLLIVGLSGSISIPGGARLYPDTDGDGFFDPDDGCPSEPEDVDGFEDDDGCPDPDNDSDGVVDVRDGCADTPEDQDGFEDEDGCPDTDNDMDGIEDVDDTCPNDPEDKDGFEDEDGCPDTDNDEDGIVDVDDKCPMEAETQNGLLDGDGCPEPDSDRDGIIDEIDECPDVPETVNGVDDEDGCPDEALVEVQENQILGGERIFFDFGMVRIKTRSRETLVQLARLLEAHPEYAVISIEGHADRVGPANFNEKLSARRGVQVKEYLVGLGISPERMVVKAYGEKKPWKPGKVDKVAARNRRVEFKIKKLEHGLAVNPIADSIKDAVETNGVSGGQEAL